MDPFLGEPMDDGHLDHGGVHPVADVGPADGLPGHPADTESSAADHLWVHTDDRVWDLGPADVDTDADGVKDSLTRPGPDGLTVYTDTDHDGQVDKITEVDKDGGFSSKTLDKESGLWSPTSRGRLE
ncbi:DUF6802 family protein [Gordonia soli]|uniref:DUF6802 domain-containing protein n=1 Tax=Gordonia soli NBRC 108243 TaxID=1223545 RepID=M0QFX4_9ACTN|nr:DUF6802 family protein [Gordonia soli]GAC67211.1 hypothetical protein GS4_06_00570 [Gordonia soli NBRC 108243]